MKNNIVNLCTIFLLTILISSCAALSTDPKSLTIMTSLAPNKKLTINVADKSAFNLDIQNPTKDTLIIKQTDNDDKVIVKNKISISALPGNNVEILNVSKSNIKPTVRVYNHTAKIVSEVSEFR